jgi:hypothetical protein
VSTATESQQEADQAAYLDGLVPLIVGVTGHRDLVPDEAPAIRALVRSFLVQLRERFPDRPLQLLSPLAEGADRLVADVALELGFALATPIAPWYRSYIGRYGDEEGPWITLSVVRSRAQFKGVLAGVLEASLIDYEGYRAPACNAAPAWRVLDLGGPNSALDEWPNAEGDRMIVQTAQCNAPGTLARRTIHAFPMRLELKQAFVAFARRRWSDAIARYEAIAFLASDPAFCVECPTDANFPGNIVARPVTAGFTIHDRFLHRDSYEVYLVPAGLDIPLLRCDDPNAECYQY